MLATIGDEMHWDSTGGIVQTQGSEGCILHGSGRYVRPPDGLGLRQSPNAWFRHENGRFSNGLMAVNIALSDVAPGDGGFCVVRGSHKLSMAVPPEVKDGLADSFAEHLHQPSMTSTLYRNLRGLAMVAAHVLRHQPQDRTRHRRSRVAARRNDPGLAALDPVVDEVDARQ